MNYKFNTKHYLFFLFCIILAFFNAGFGERLFSANDGPYGLMEAYNDHRWDYFWNGTWQYHNWIGGSTLNTVPNFSHSFYLVFGALFFSKWVACASLIFLSWAAYFLGKTYKWSDVSCFILGLAAGLNGNLLSHAGWGLSARPASVAFTLLALGCINLWSRNFKFKYILLTGLFTGFTVLEGADSGALLSLLIGAYFTYKNWEVRIGPVFSNLWLYSKNLGIIVVCSICVAISGLYGLYSTQVTGTELITQSKNDQYSYVTSWSFPPVEMLRIGISGLLGHKSNTLELTKRYVGRVGSSGKVSGRYNGASEYVGIGVLMIIGWYIWITRRNLNKELYFWIGISVLTLLLSFGHFTPLYKLYFEIPYLSLIRIPMKFLHLFNIAVLVMFGYSINELCLKKQS